MRVAYVADADVHNYTRTLCRRLRLLLLAELRVYVITGLWLLYSLLSLFSSLLFSRLLFLVDCADVVRDGDVFQSSAGASGRRAPPLSPLIHAGFSPFVCSLQFVV